MKRKYLVKKDSAKNGQDNWIIMNNEQFLAWKTTPEGQLRYSNFGRLDACDRDDYIIYMECDKETRTQWKKESDRQKYNIECEKKTKYRVISYHVVMSGDEEVNGEEILRDSTVNVEDETIWKIELETLHRAIASLKEKDRMLIEYFFLADDPSSETELSNQLGVALSTLHSRKKAALGRLKKILEKEFV